MTVAELAIAPETFEEFLEAEGRKDLLRLSTAGSVDDGKSTLIGRLLYDSRGIYEDQLESVTKASVGRNAGVIDFSLLTDGLRAEREQGITIDVAYRYFATPKRKFIIADTPGHEQYTRNMVTGASTAELAIVLVDARKGVLPQSRRHAFIAKLLGLSHLVVAINKMDLVGYDQQVFNAIVEDFREFLGEQSTQPYFVPISALEGDNVVSRSSNMPWFKGVNLLEYLETVPVDGLATQPGFRFPVQRVVRPDQHFRGYAGTVAGGKLQRGDDVIALPSGRRSAIASITTFDGDLSSANADSAVTISLADEIDISRGDMLVSAGHLPFQSNAFEATLVWLNENPGQEGAAYRLKHTTRSSSAELVKIAHRININTLAHESASSLAMNEIGLVHIDTARSLFFDLYKQNRKTGSFILIDPATNATIAAGLITAARQPSRSDELAYDWKIENGSLVISLADSKGYFAPPESDSPESSSAHRLHDLEAVTALEQVLRRLRIETPQPPTPDDEFSI